MRLASREGAVRSVAAQAAIYREVRRNHWLGSTTIGLDLVAAHPAERAGPVAQGSGDGPGAGGMIGRLSGLINTALGTVSLARDWVGVSLGRRAQPNLGAGRHVALFAWALPPNSNAGVHRPLSFICHGSRFGWRFSTFQGETPDNQSQHGDELLAKLPPGIRRVVIAPRSRPSSWRLFPRVDGGFPNAVETARHAIDALHDDPPDIVLASGPPFSMFLAARWVARQFRVPLVLDYRDEWTQCPFDFVDAGPDDVRFERLCLSSAAATVFTTQSHLEHQLASFAELDRSRAHLIPNGWEPEDFISFAQPCATQDRLGPLRIFHVGTLSGHTSPVVLVAALNRMLEREPYWREHLRLTFIGRQSPEARMALAQCRFPEVIDSIDHVSKGEAVRFMASADALLLLAAPELERYLPGKLFDYVAAGRPVLIFGSGGESSQVLVRDLCVGVLCESPHEANLSDALRMLLERRNTSLLGGEVAPWLQRHRRDILAGHAFTLFDQLIRREHT